MSKYLTVQNGNYYVKVQKGRNITLDVGYEPYPGKVVITGDLEVAGTTTTINTEVVTIRDNKILLNSGPYQTGGFEAGIDIARDNATYGNASFLLDNNQDHYNSSFQVRPGIWKFVDGNGSLMGIQTASIDTDGQNLYLINQGTGFVSTRGVTNYEKLVFDYSAYDANVGPIGVGADINAIPNVKGVLECIQSAFLYQSSNNITDYDTSVTVNDLSSTGNPSVITFKVDNNQKVLIDGSGTTFDNIKIFANTIASLNSNNIVLSPITKTIQASGWMLFDNQASIPSASAGGTYLYADSTIGAGKTGLYIVNTTVSDELVSKKRALLFSMIF